VKIVAKSRSGKSMPVFPRDKRKSVFRGDHAQAEGWNVMGDPKKVITLRLPLTANG
jgi:hypothetical protein